MESSGNPARRDCPTCEDPRYSGLDNILFVGGEDTATDCNMLFTTQFVLSFLRGAERRRSKDKFVIFV